MMICQSSRASSRPLPPIAMWSQKNWNPQNMWSGQRGLSSTGIHKHHKHNRIEPAGGIMDVLLIATHGEDIM